MCPECAPHFDCAIGRVGSNCKTAAWRRKRELEAAARAKHEAAVRANARKRAREERQRARDRAGRRPDCGIS